jgi:hypothetical protein
MFGLLLFRVGLFCREQGKKKERALQRAATARKK